MLLTLAATGKASKDKATKYGAGSLLPNPAHIPLSGPIRFQARNIVFHVIDGVHLTVKSIDALVMPTRAGQTAVLDDPTSMKVQILSSESSMSAESMTALLNDYAIPHAQLPLHALEVSFEDGEVFFKGKVHKMVELPFTAEARLSVTPSGDLHLQFVRITVAGLLHKRVLDLLGLNVASLTRPSDQHSFLVQDDDVYFPIHALFPAPHFNGRLRSAKIVDGELIQVFGTPVEFPPAPAPAEHYVYFRGGVLQFGRLTMQGVDLELVNKDKDEVFELSLTNLFEQALPGYFTNLPDRGMVAHIQSYHDAAGTRAVVSPAE